MRAVDWNGWSCATRFKERIDAHFIWDEPTYRNKTSPYRIPLVKQDEQDI